MDSFNEPAAADYEHLRGDEALAGHAAGGPVLLGWLAAGGVHGAEPELCRCTGSDPHACRADYPGARTSTYSCSASFFSRPGTPGAWSDASTSVTVGSGGGVPPYAGQMDL